MSLIGGEENPALRAAPDSPVITLVERAAVTIEAGASLADAARLMRLEGVSSVLVNGGMAIATERDISRGIGAGVAPEEKVGTVATPHPVVVDGSLSVAKCAGIMLHEEIRHLIVRMPDGSAGVVSLRDVAAVMLRNVEIEPRRPIRRESGSIPSEAWLG
ncbi:MAG: CBS domain-containing protein [bacterium]